MSRSSRGLAVLASALVAVALTASACSEPETENTVTASDGVTYDLSPEQGGRIHVDKVDEIAAKVPQSIRDRGTLIGTGSTGATPPLGFYATDDKTPIGSEIDLSWLVADTLGLRYERQTADWAQNFVKIDSGENDVFIANVTVTEERKDKYDFATYRLDNVAFEAKKDSGWTVQGRKDIVGKKIGVSSGTNQEQLLVDWNEQNAADGLAPAEIAYYQNTSDYYLALGSGRIGAYFGPNPSAVYHSSSTGETEVIGTFSGAGDALQGEIAVLTKKDNGLVGPIQEALNHVIEDGSYEKVLEKWGLQSEAVSESIVNPPGLPRKAP
ncbi:ABC transporter substrate-binding protein [Rhodococcus sp. G-MC3]|uniref:ABC transporter substrate-binding protein n=1 Tax=Rhodococcus sp. G-MC3 TaxID=3046209 RepID=UPI0024BACCA0|nr:ABC transporter substrate-binding protein [Rhodococcus sp. G-MC3]MDJ0393297.1 ABC transporter substrate-binding protein [Rhodococcus sp. G-MC3]